MQVGASRLPRRLLPHPVVHRVAVIALKVVLVAPVETGPKEIAPVVTVEAAEAVAIAVARDPAATAVAEAVEVVAVSVAGLDPAVLPAVLVDVATAMCRAARCAPSAWTALWRSTTRTLPACAATSPSAARSSLAARPAPALDTSVASA